MIKFTPEQIKKFPVAHLSFSAIRCYMTNRQLFYKRFIRQEYDDRTGPSLIEGKAYHKGLELLWNDVKVNRYDFETMQADDELWFQVHQIAHTKLVEQVETGDVDFGKTGSIAKSLKTVEQGLNWYRNEAPSYLPVAVEAKVTAECADLNGEIMPIPLKIVYDLLSEETKEIDVVDHKFVSQFEDEEVGSAAFELQAGASFFTVQSKFGRAPKRMIFDQMKKSKNSDGSPQRRPYIINFFDDNGKPHPCLARFIEVYRRVVMELAGFPLIDEEGRMRFMPNPFDMLSGEEAWIDFCREVDTGIEAIPAEVLAELKAKSENIEALNIE